MEESGDDEPPNQISKKGKLTQSQKQIKWTKTGTVWITPTDFIDYDEKLKLNLPDGTLRRFSSPIELFELFFTDGLVEHIFSETKLFNEWWRHLNSSTRKVPEIEKEEIRKVIGIVLCIEIMKLPNRRMYWNTKCSSELISWAMLRNRFDEIMMVLHFNDNNEIRTRDDPL